MHLSSDEKIAQKSQGTSATPHLLHDGSEVEACVVVKKDPAEVYAFWRQLGNLPLFMKDLESVIELPYQKSLWKVRLGSGIETGWTAQIIADIPGKLISWQSTEDSEIQQAGSVWFEKSSREEATVVKLQMSYKIPGGFLGEIAARLILDDPKTVVENNLARLKALLETGTPEGDF